MKASSPSRREVIRWMLAGLKMPGALEAIDEVLSKADSRSVTPAEAILELLGAQISLRNNRRLLAAMRSSRLPAVKTLEEFDLSLRPSIKREQIDSLAELGFLERKENVVLLGPPGMGKTHLAIALAITAAQRGRRVYYGALADLVSCLEQARASGSLKHRLLVLSSAPLAHGGGRDRLSTSQPDRGHVVLPADEPPLRANLHRADLKQELRGVGRGPRERGDGGCPYRSGSTPLSHRKYPRQFLSHARAYRAMASSKPGRLCGFFP